MQNSAEIRGKEIFKATQRGRREGQLLQCQVDPGPGIRPQAKEMLGI